jgi:hypothetical protein
MAGEYPIEDVHRLLEGLESLLSILRSPGPERILVEQLPELFETIHELGGWRNTTYLQTKLGINGSLLNQFMQLRGSIQRSDALKIADRLRSYLRSHDQATDAPDQQVRQSSVPAKRKSSERKAARLTTTIKADHWIALRESSEIKLKIGAIASLLDSIVQQIRHANAPPEDQILTDIERQQLIAILETALNVLRSPMVEKGLLRRATSTLQKAAENAAEKSIQQGLGKLMEGGAARIAELVALLFN